MGKKGQTGQQAIKAAILHDVYCNNLASEKLQQLNQRRRGTRRWMRVVVLAFVLPLAGLATHTLFYSSDTATASPDKIMDAKYVVSDWRRSLPPLIHDANASVVPLVPERFMASSFSDNSGMPAGKGAVLLSDGGKQGISPDESGLMDSRISSASDYQILIDQPEVAIADLFGLGVHTIIIDAGHGGEDPGAIGANGLMEKDITLKIARLLYNRLVDEEGINVIMTRDSDVTLSLKHRVEYARQHDADLLVSIHLNTIPNNPMTIVETYYFGPPADAQSVKVARKENYHSGYAVAEFNELITELGDTLKQQESRKLASHIQKNVYNTLSRHNRSIINVGIKTAPFVILLGAETPSVLAEVTCISNTDEEARLAKPAYRDKIAGALERGILSYLNQLRQQDRQRPEQGSTTYAES